MRGPDFDELVGEDLGPRERERLRRAHDALLAAGPPPELPAHLARPARPRRRAGALALPLAAALALAAAAFAAGWLAKPAPHEVDFTLGMHGTAAAPSASAELLVYEKDPAGNWPMEMTISGLPNGRYELVLTRDGKPVASCGVFLVNGRTVTLLNAPYRLRQYDGWAVTRPGSARILLRTDEI
jgi:ParB-like chromosome segregation protein Spo0J